MAVFRTTNILSLGIPLSAYSHPHTHPCPPGQVESLLPSASILSPKNSLTS